MLLGRDTIAASVFDLDDLDALKVEHDENEQRKEPTVSEKVALAAAIVERLKGRQLANLKQNREGNISHSDESGRTKDLAAAKAGLGSGKTLDAAQKVVERTSGRLVDDALIELPELAGLPRFRQGLSARDSAADHSRLRQPTHQWDPWHHGRKPTRPQQQAGRNVGTHSHDTSACNGPCWSCSWSSAGVCRQRVERDGFRKSSYIRRYIPAGNKEASIAAGFLFRT